VARPSERSVICRLLLLDATVELRYSSLVCAHIIIMDSLRPPNHISFLLKFIAIIGLISALFYWTGVNLGHGAGWPRSVLYPLGIAVLCAFSIMRPKAKSPRCKSCGKGFYPTRKAELSGLCPACRTAKLPPQQRRRLATQGFLIIVVLLLMLSFLLLWPFSGLVQARLGRFAYPMIVIGLFVGLIMLCAAGLVLRSLLTMRRMSNPAHALEVARACGREPGKQATFGSVSVFLFGADDPSSMLKGQMEICRSRFESLVGEPVESDRPLRCFVFGKRDSFDAFFRRAFLYGSNLDGMYVPWSTPTIVMTAEFPAHRLADPERVIRVLLSYSILDTYRQSPSPFWLQTGLAHVVARGGDEMELARLNRKMLAAFSRGTSLGSTDLFHAKRRRIVTLVRDWRDFNNHCRYTQLIDQSCSVVEFLCSERQRRERLRAFLREPASKTPIEEVFPRHFGYGLEMVLEQWRSWVLGRETGSHGPAPSHIGHALQEKVIPIVQDHGANQLERIQAIRDMGKSGYVLGADALIELLGKDNQIPAEEVVWSLESISGLALGHDLDGWTKWFNHLPEETVRVADLAR
jgi:hypothetical protein